MPLERLRSVVSYALTNPYSRMYERLYQGRVDALTLATKRDWERIPLISKTDLEPFSFWERVHQPRHTNFYIRATSGTTSGKPFVCSRERPFTDLGPYVHTFTVTGLLASLSTIPSHLFAGAVQQYTPTAPVIRYDPGNPGASIALAAHAGINIMVCFTFHIEAMLPHIEKYRLGEHVRLCMYAGEALPHTTLTKLRNCLPHATIVNGYGFAEGPGHVMLATETDPHDGLFLSKPSEYFFPEIISDDGTAIDDDGVEGELIVTTLWDNNTLPLIRYRTGDLARIATHNGERHYKISGRKNTDRIRIRTGGIISMTAIDRIMQARGLDDAYQATYHNNANNEEVPPRLTIALLHGRVSTPLPILAKEIAKELGIGPDTTYDKAVERGELGELTCHEVPELTKTGLKTKRLLKHE